MTDGQTERFHAAEQRAFAEAERRRWPGGARCPRCGGGRIAPAEYSGKGGKPCVGRRRCRGCRYDFSVRTGSEVNLSKIPLQHWMMADRMMETARRPISRNDLMDYCDMPWKTAVRVAAVVRRHHPLFYADKADGRAELLLLRGAGNLAVGVLAWRALSATGRMRTSGPFAIAVTDAPATWAAWSPHGRRVLVLGTGDLPPTTGGGESGTRGPGVPRLRGERPRGGVDLPRGSGA